jgi:hypothetical protein
VRQNFALTSLTLSFAFKDTGPFFPPYFATNISDSMPRSDLVALLLPGSDCAFYLHFFTGIYRASPVKYVIYPVNKVKIDYRNLQLIIDATLLQTAGSSCLEAAEKRHQLQSQADVEPSLLRVDLAGLWLSAAAAVGSGYETWRYRTPNRMSTAQRPVYSQWRLRTF